MAPPEGLRRLYAGVDTHSQIHVAAIIDAVGRELGHRSFATTNRGLHDLLAWLQEADGALVRVGVEGTGAWGAGLTRVLRAAGVEVVEVDRPDRSARRRQGKSDPLDAYAAARAAASRRADAVPKSRDGNVEMIRQLRVVRAGAVKARSAAWNQLKALISTAPNDLRETLRGLDGATLLRACEALDPQRGPAPPVRPRARPRPGKLADPTAACVQSLLLLAARIRAFDLEVRTLDDDLEPLVADTAPTLLDMFGVSTDVAGSLLVTVGDNPTRLATSAAFAHLCGVAPVPASSGKHQRHRLNRGGNRQANCALHRIVLTRLRYDPDTRAYRDRRAAEQKSPRAIIRCLKRYVAREVYSAILADLAPATTVHDST